MYKNLFFSYTRLIILFVYHQKIMYDIMNIIIIYIFLFYHLIKKISCLKVVKDLIESFSFKY